MSKIRINDLARELEVKSKAILDVLPGVGVTEKKTHSSSLEDYEAEKVRVHFRAAAGDAPAASKAARSIRTGSDEIKTKIDLSHISRPGDVLSAIRKQQAPPAPVRPPVAQPPAEPIPVAPTAPVAPVAKSPVAAPVPPRPVVPAA